MGKHYPSDVSDEEWAFVIGYLALCREDARQREHSLRAVFNGLHYIVRTGNQWRFTPGDLSPWLIVYPQIGGRSPLSHCGRREINCHHHADQIL